jgi:nucleoside-diphosphate-sugar epimerase
LVGLENLVDLLTLSLRHPDAADQTLLVSDGRDVSTAELIRLLAAALGRKAYLLPVPLPLLRAGAALMGKKPAFDRLTESLQADIDSTTARLGWTPPISLERGLWQTASAFKGAST